MKKKILLLVLACIFCFALAIAGCANKEEKISVSITNKEALTAEWTEEGENRTVELNIAPDRYNKDNSEVVVTSDNSDVVKADGLTLYATGGGTANITVNLGKASDTVAITVTPKLRGISIENKEGLKDIWVVGQPDRTLSVSAVYKKSSAPLTASDVTVTSSAPDIIVADGLSLKAKAIGEAEITVTHGEFTDKVSLSVFPALESFEISNKTELANVPCGVESEIQATFAPADYYNANNTRPVITCQPEGVIEQVEGYTIKAKATGTATVTVTVGDKSDSFEISVSYGVPTIEFEIEESENVKYNETATGLTINVLQTGYVGGNETITLPEIVAKTSDGLELEATVQTDLTVTNNTVSLAAGEGYTITYKATDGRDTSKFIEKILTINVYRKVFNFSNSSVNLTADSLFATDENQTVTVIGSATSRARFNMEPGKLYYAEVTYVLPAYDASNNNTNPVIGLTHFISDNTSRTQSFVLGRVSGALFITDNASDPDGYWNSKATYANIKADLKLTDKDGYVFPANTSQETGLKVKIAIARNDDMFYLFVNDVLIDVRTLDKDYVENDTVPGIYGGRLGNTPVTGISFFGGDSAQAKINSLLPVSATISNKAELEAEWVDDDATRTLAYAFGSDDHPEADITVASSNPEVISVNGFTLTALKRGIAEISLKLNGSVTDKVSITVNPKQRGIAITNQSELNKAWIAGQADRTVTVSKTYKYADDAQPLTANDFTVISSAPEIIEVNGATLKAKAVGTATITVKNGNFETSIEITVSSALESITVTNGQDFDNIEIGMEKTVNVSLTPATFTQENTTPVITCAPQGIIEQVEGYTIRAKAAGTATVTVTVEGVSTTFTVIVTYGKPTITFAQIEGLEQTATGAIYNVSETGYVGEQSVITLPEVTASASDGQSITPTATAEFAITNNTVSLAKGTGYTVMYRAVDSRDTSKFIEKTLTINVYRKVLSYNGANADNTKNFYVTQETAYADDDKQVVKINDVATEQARFNMAPSKLYYAEVTYLLPAYDAGNNSTNPVIGLTHFIGDNTSRQQSYVLGRNSGTLFITDNASDPDGFYNSKATYANIKADIKLTDKDGYVFPADTTTTAGAKVKIAIARNGDKFYMFVNDVLIDVRTLDKDYVENDTVPGIYGARLISTQITNIAFCSGGSVQTKIDELLPKLIISNEAELKAEWTDDDISREVRVSFGSDYYTAENMHLTVRVTEGDAVSAVGLVITANKRGTATITVSADYGLAKTFEITVNPKQRGIAVTNQSELTAAWTVGQADRTVTVSKMFKHADDAQPLSAEEFTVTSSAPEIIEVSGASIKAKDVGKATLTVKSGDFETSIEITVSSALESIVIANASELENLVNGSEYTINVALTPSSFTQENTTPVITCEPQGIIAQVEGYTIRAIAAGTATVTVTIEGVTATCSVTVEYGTPTVTFEEVDGLELTAEGATLNVLQTGYADGNETVTLPTVTAQTSDGQSITPTVTADFEIMNDTVSLAKGTGYTVTYKATDERDTTKFIEKTLTINVYRKVFSYKGPNGLANEPHPEWDFIVSTENVEDKNQIVKVGTSYAIRSTLNLAPSKLYYAEVTYVLPAYSSKDNKTNPLLGMGHFVGEEKTRCLSNIVGRASGGVFIADWQSGKNCWDNPFSDGNYNLSAKTSLKEKDGYAFPAETSATAGGKVKFAVARSGNIYYMFINDVLIEQRDMTGLLDGYYEGDTVPGISGDRLINCTVVDISFCGGEEAQTKIESLTSAVTPTQASAYGAEPAMLNHKEEEYE